jgi:hypothetical protein
LRPKKNVQGSKEAGMSSLLEISRKQCTLFCEYLESNSDSSSEAQTVLELLAFAPRAQRHHASACTRCHAAASDFLASRDLLRVLPAPSHAVDPWFATRVIAAIGSREPGIRRVLDTWTAVPKLAARLTWMSAVALLLAATWLYERPGITPAKAVITDLTGEIVEYVQQPATNDEVLASLVEKN